MIYQKRSILKLLEILIIIFTILDATTMWKYLDQGIVKKYGVTVEITKYIVFLCISLYIIILGKSLKRKNIRAIIFVMAYNCFYILVSRTNISSFIKDFLMVIIFWMLFIQALLLRGRLGNIIKEVKNILFVLALISLILYFLGTMLHIIPASMVSVSRNSSVGISHYYVPSYFHLMYNGQTQNIMGHTVLRNTGIFLEAPGWAFYISIALLLELFYTTNISRIRVFILTITALTTFATKAFICFPLLIFLRFFKNNTSKFKVKELLKKISVPLVLLFGFFYLNFLLTNKQSYNAASYLGRGEDLVAAILVWKSHPIFGVGYNVTTAFEQFLENQQTSSITAGLIKMLAQCGIFIGIEYLFGMFANIIESDREKRYIQICTLIMMTFYLLVSSTWSNMVFLFMVAFGFCKIAGIEKQLVRNIKK